MENKIIKISVDTLGSETSVENLIRGLNNSFLRNYFYSWEILEILNPGDPGYLLDENA